MSVNGFDKVIRAYQSRKKRKCLNKQRDPLIAVMFNVYYKASNPQRWDLLRGGNRFGCFNEEPIVKSGVLACPSEGLSWFDLLLLFFLGLCFYYVSAYSSKPFRATPIQLRRMNESAHLIWKRSPYLCFTGHLDILEIVVERFGKALLAYSEF